MGGISVSALVWFGFWMILAIGAFALSFGFDRPLGIYDYGTAAWPRMAILIIAAAAVMQLRADWQRGTPAARMPAAAGTGPSAATIAHVAVMLGVPVLYGLLLDRVGFYALTPLFVAIMLMLGGERRPLRVLLVTTVIYGVILLLFTLVLFRQMPVGTIQIFYDFSNWLLVLLRPVN